MMRKVIIRFLDNYSTFNARVTVDCDYINNHDDLVNYIAEELGIGVNDFELVNEEQFWEDMDCPASEITK